MRPPQYAIITALALCVCPSPGVARESYSLLPTNQISETLAPLVVNPFTLRGELGRRIEITITNNLEQLDIPKHFAGYFIQKNGPNVAGGFIGMGMLIDACARFAAFTQDPGLAELKGRLVDTVISAQLEDGYSGFYQATQRLWNTSGGTADNWDIHEMAFIMTGLLSDYELFGNRRSLNAATKTADHILNRWDDMPANYAARVDLHVLNTGLDNAILRLYQATGEPRFLNFATKRKSLYDWNTDIVLGRRLGVSGHIFAYLAMCEAQLNLYRLTGDRQLLKQTKKAVDFMINQNGLTITGSAGQREVWTDDQDGEHELGETCATAYQLRLYENLLRLTGQPQYGDLIERTLLNGLFAAQSPSGDQLRYYTPFEGPRKYYPHQHMCCPGNYRRIISEIPRMIYYRTADDGIAVNLYNDSSGTLVLSDQTKVKIEQRTDYPSSGRIEIRVTAPPDRAVPLLLRIPSWATHASGRIGNETLNHPITAGSFLRLNRKWSAAEPVVLEFEMKPRFVKGRQCQSGRVAIMRGPVIYGLNLEANPGATLNGKRTLADLRRLLLDPATISDVVPDDRVRPGGTALHVRAWREDQSRLADVPHEFTLKLTEFPDPGSQQIYFKLPDYRTAVDDELFRVPLLVKPAAQ